VSHDLRADHKSQVLAANDFYLDGVMQLKIQRSELAAAQRAGNSDSDPDDDIDDEFSLGLPESGQRNRQPIADDDLDDGVVSNGSLSGR
jgi:hypothetical protein